MASVIQRRLKDMMLNIQVMHVCGTHQDTLERYGLNPLLKDSGIIVRQGPGCPVCVTTSHEYEMAMTLARGGKTLVTFGDAARVPGRRGSLLDLRGEGCDIRVVYGVEDAIEIARTTESEVVFFAVGFETTAPGTAMSLLKEPPSNFSVLSCHRYIPPVLDSLLGMGEFKPDGLIQPGHVSAIIGLQPYEALAKKYRLPQVIAGFEPLDLLMAIYMIAKQVSKGEARVENEYTRVVHPEGNTKALKALDDVFVPRDLAWRGFATIPNSGMGLLPRFSDWDAERIYQDELSNVPSDDEKRGCRCGDILRGVIESHECPLFGKICTPANPVGPCMVSIEGSCGIEYRHRKTS